MVNTIVDGTFRQTNLTNESSEYLAKREELRLAEIELMRQRERVAEMRRHLPEGAAVQDYQFEEGPRGLNAGDGPERTVRLSELFTGPNRALVIYHFMFGKKQTKASPMCTAWLDSANGAAHHLAQNLDFAVAAAADLATLRAYGRERGWDKLRLLSTGNNTFKYDLRQRRSTRRTGLNRFRFYPRRQGDGASLLYSASPDGTRHSGARHRSADSYLALHGHYPARPEQLVRQPGLRY
jgi:predicted dithiol-disulfide oxidoreductase (DUF899 family)